MARDSVPFNLVFGAVLALTVLSGLVAVWIACYWNDPTHNQQEIFEALDFTWKAGVGAIFTLLGGPKIRSEATPTKKNHARINRAGQ
jgi:hypothetical protein